MVKVDAGSFLAIVVTAALAALLAGIFARKLLVPVVVLELLLGIVIGPEGLHLAQPDAFVDFFSSLGLGMLFFFAGYEIDFERIRGSRCDWARSAGCCRSCSPTRSAVCSRRWASCSRCCSSARRWRRPRSERKALSARERVALALFSATELPLVVAITTIAVDDGHMRSSTAASLILAAICSTAIYPILGLRLRAATEREAFLAAPESMPSR